MQKEATGMLSEANNKQRKKADKNLTLKLEFLSLCMLFKSDI